MMTETTTTRMLDTDVSGLLADWTWLYDAGKVLDLISVMDPATGDRYELAADTDAGLDLEACEWPCDVRSIEDIAQVLRVPEQLDVDGAFRRLTEEHDGRRVWRALDDSDVLDILDDCVLDAGRAC